MRYREGVNIGMILGLCAAASPAIGAEARPPLEVVKSLVETIRAFERPEDGASLTPIQQQENARIVEKAHAVLDFEGLARRSLGSTWEASSSAKRREAVDLLRRIFAEIAYPESAKFFGKLSLDYDDLGRRGDHHVIAIAVSHPDEGLIDLEFHLSRLEGTWKVVDLHMDMVSLATDIRTQMQRIIADDGYDELLRRMRAKLAEEGVSASTAGG